jgi:hypothetical protein
LKALNAFFSSSVRSFMTQSVPAFGEFLYCALYLKGGSRA